MNDESGKRVGAGYITVIVGGKAKLKDESRKLKTENGNGEERDRGRKR